MNLKIFIIVFFKPKLAWLFAKKEIRIIKFILSDAYRSNKKIKKRQKYEIWVEFFALKTLQALS